MMRINPGKKTHCPPDTRRRTCRWKAEKDMPSRDMRLHPNPPDPTCPTGTEVTYDRSLCMKMHRAVVEWHEP